MKDKDNNDDNKENNSFYCRNTSSEQIHCKYKF